MLLKNDIIGKLFSSKEFNDCINKMEPEHLRDDLKSEVVMILLEMDEKKIIDLHQKNELKFYAVRIILNLMQSSSSPFYKKFRGLERVYMDDMAVEHDRSEGQRLFNDAAQIADASFIDVEGVFTERVAREEMEDLALKEVDNLYWYDREIIRLYLQLGSYRKVEAETGIPWESIYFSIAKARKKIRQICQQPKS